MSVRILLALFLLSLLLFAYPVSRLGFWLQLDPVLNLLITTPLFLSQFIARVVLRHRRGKLTYLCRGAADFFLGLSPLLLAQVLLAEILLAVTGWGQSMVAWCILGCTIAVAAWGLRKAWTPEVVEVSLSSTKLSRPLRFVQISDVHIGSRTSRFLRKVIATVNELQPDFLCITGDFIDQPGLGLDILAPLREFAGPVYYCTGNHERYEDLEAIVERLESLGVEVLRNRHIVAQGLQIIGIEDHDSAKQVARVLPFMDLRRDLYTILLYHRPQGLEAAREHGVDLKLSGHTHNGQIAPFHLAVNRVFEYTSGLYQSGDTYLYVNEGTGTWGPTLRLGSRSEITLFDIRPDRERPTI